MTYLVTRCMFFFFLMIRRPPRSTLFPYPPLSRSAPGGCPARAPADRAGDRHPGRDRLDPADDRAGARDDRLGPVRDRKSTRLNSSHANISYAVFCLKKKKKTT